MTRISQQMYPILIRALLVFILTIALCSMSKAETKSKTFKKIPLQYIVALGDPQSSSGTGAESWGLWRQDPGPRGCLLENYDALKATGVSPHQWKFDSADWWLEEHGLLMEKPEFPLATGDYVVTGGRTMKSILTVYPPSEDGTQRWQLSNGAKLYDVTHLPCHAARYTPAEGENSCSPKKVAEKEFPVEPGAVMPAVEGCKKQDYAVFFVIGVGAK